MRRALSGAWAGALVLVCSAAPGFAADPAAAPVVAQASPLPARHAGPEQPLPRVAPAAPSHSAVAAPPPPGPAARLSQAPRFRLRNIAVDGDTVLGSAAIEKVIAPYRGKLVSIADLDEIRRRLTLLYIKAGYINSGVTIPDQNVTGGLVKMHVVEGRVTQVEITGTKQFRPEYFRSRLAAGLHDPFNIRDAEVAQQLLLQEPLVKRLNIDLLPGLAPGQARMRADVTEASPYSLSAQIADDQSPTVGEVRGQLAGSVANLWGTGDVLSAGYGRSQGLNDGSVSYSIPLAPDDTILNLRYDRNGTLVVAPALAPLHVSSDYSSVSLGLTRPFYRTPEQNLTLGVQLDWRRAQSFLLGTPFPFVAGADVNGRTNVTALRVTQSWLDRDADHALGLRSTFSFGLNILDATVLPPQPGGRVASGEFFAWLGQAQYVHRLWHNSEVVLRSDVQLANGPLFPIEQFALGGIDTVRGYREYLTVTDDAAFASGELRIPVGKVRLPVLARGDDAGTVQLVPFYDYGRGWNVGRPTPAPADISSVGLGLRWLVGSGITAELYYGKALRHVPVGTSLQDRGIHFRITAAFF
ncbi:MAG TPA: ShlB/FhaC/HecB family hemolysin secretion/activation protein [Stellaceae bacterium]|nr:ShlB/FhaC/HecB family hemolysin secretion/activation protein [Stellaceae bacterium]